MRIDAEQVLCRFHVTSGDRHRLTPVHEWIVTTAHELRLQGATVLEGIAGYWLHNAPSRDSIWSLARRLPLIVEVIDQPASIERLLARLEPDLTHAIVTLERAHVAIYRGGPDSPAQSPAPINILSTRHQNAAIEVTTMNIPEEGVLLRIFIGESDRDAETDEALYKSLVRRAHEAGLAGATVLQSPLGFGRHSRVHSSGLLEMSTDLPIVVEIVDAEAKIQAFLPVLDELVTEGLVTLEGVRVLKYVSP